VSGATTAARSATPPTGRASALVGAGLTACCGAMRQISASTPTPDCPDGLDQPSAAQLGRSPRAATSRADGVSGRSTRRQAHWSAARIHSPPKMPAGTGAVAFRSVFAFIESPNLQQAAFAHFRGKRSLHYPGALGLREWVRVVLCWPLIFFLGSK
jgi:hypothetical protein